MGRQVSHNPAASRGACRWGFFIGNLFGSGGIDPCFGKPMVTGQYLIAGNDEGKRMPFKAFRVRCTTGSPEMKEG